MLLVLQWSTRIPPPWLEILSCQPSATASQRFSHYSGIKHTMDALALTKAYSMIGITTQNQIWPYHPPFRSFENLKSLLLFWSLLSPSLHSGNIWDPRWQASMLSTQPKRRLSRGKGSSFVRFAGSICAQLIWAMSTCVSCLFLVHAPVCQCGKTNIWSQITEPT